MRSHAATSREDPNASRHRSRRCVAALLVSAVLLSGCGSDDGGGSGDGAAEDVPAGDDRAAVERAIAAFEATLRAEGFAPGSEDEEDGSDDLQFATEECKEFEALFGDDELPGSTADLDSASMERGELDGEGGAVETVDASVALVADEKDIEAFFATLRDDRLQPCLEEAAEASFAEQSSEGGEGEGLEATDISISLPEPSGVGDDSFAIALTGTFTVPDFTFPFGFRFDFASKGRAAAFLSLGAVGAESADVEAASLLRQLLDEAG